MNRSLPRRPCGGIEVNQPAKIPYWRRRLDDRPIPLGDNIGAIVSREIVLRIKHAVLNEEGELARLRREVDRLENLERVVSTPREPIPDEVRTFVWQRDNGRCVKSGGQERLEFDHIIPLTKGGANTQRNVQLLCETCNRQKGAAV